VALDDVCRHGDAVLLPDDGAEGRCLLAKRGLRKCLVYRGIAAPRIGIGRAVALVCTPDGETITLINPRVRSSATSSTRAAGRRRGAVSPMPRAHPNVAAFRRCRCPRDAT
jgi:hypothetical protein